MFSCITARLTLNGADRAIARDNRDNRVNGGRMKGGEGSISISSFEMDFAGRERRADMIR
jgi:hypothetical protein